MNDEPISKSFTPFNKIPRLNRLCTITEKIDGTNASVCIAHESEVDGGYGIGGSHWISLVNGFYVAAGSRTRWIKPGDDNFGFAAWVRDNTTDLLKLGRGLHFGEWWGQGIQRGYGLAERRFSLFNTARWGDAAVRPACCNAVPVIYEGPFRTEATSVALDRLRIAGSQAAIGFMNPEGIVVYHRAANHLFKATIKGDEEGKHADAHVKKERLPREPKDGSKGGRRKEQLPFDGPDRRVK
jgi:hypothetical protein